MENTKKSLLVILACIATVPLYWIMFFVTFYLFLIIWLLVGKIGNFPVNHYGEPLMGEQYENIIMIISSVIISGFVIFISKILSDKIKNRLPIFVAIATSLFLIIRTIL